MITLTETSTRMKLPTYQVAFAIGKLLREGPQPKNLLQEIAYGACLEGVIRAHIGMGCYAMEKCDEAGIGNDW